MSKKAGSANPTLIDAYDSNALIYPAYQKDNCEGAIGKVRRDILPQAQTSTAFFPLDFCLYDQVIDAVAKKYEADAAHYMELEADDEHFLISVNACKKDAKKMGCPYMGKALARMASDRRVPIKKICAIYLLGLDESEDNRQKFLAMGKSKLYLFNSTGKIAIYDYEDIKFIDAGIVKVNSVGDYLEDIIAYSFDEKFLTFVGEFMLLRFNTLCDIAESHPFGSFAGGDMVDEFLPEAKLNSPTLVPTEKKHAYMHMLVDAAAAEGKLETYAMLRLVYLAHEFHLSADTMLSFLTEAQRGGIKKNQLLFRLSEVEKFIGSAEYKTAFYQDLLEMALSQDGTIIRGDLVKILKKEQFAGEKFVDAYIDFVRKRRDGEKALSKALKFCEKKELRLAAAVRMQNFNNRLNLQIITIGAMINE